MTHEIVTPGFVRVDARGEFLEVLNEGDWRSVITGSMAAGAVMGQHYHRRIRVFFFLRRGRAQVRTVNVDTGGRDAFVLEDGQGVFLEPRESHAIRFLTAGDFLMLKSEAYDRDDPDTVHYPVPDADAAC